MECSICLNHTQFNSNGIKPKNCNDTRLKCKHMFHRKCIKTWFNVNDTCPMCRQDIKFKEGSYYKSLMYLFSIRKYINLIEYFLIYDGYIYYDNSSIILFINFIKQNLLHFSKTYTLFYKI